MKALCIFILSVLLCAVSACDKQWTLDRIPIENGLIDCSEDPNVCGVNATCINGFCECNDFFWGDDCTEEVITFEKILTGSGEDYCNYVTISTDNNYIFTGSTESFSDEDISGINFRSLFLLKTDTYGNQLWLKTFGGDNYTEGNKVYQTSDDGFIIIGSGSGFNGEFDNGTFDIYIIKTDANGNEIWSRVFDYAGTEYGNDIIITNDDGYLITGQFGFNPSDLCLLKVDENGNEQWFKTFGGSGNDRGNNIVLGSNGGYVITGSKEINGNIEIYLLKVDENGNEIWSKTYGGQSNEEGIGLTRTYDGGYLITGWSVSFDFNRSAFLIKTDDNGNEVWTKSYGNDGWDLGNEVIITKDGGYLFVGYTQEVFGEEVDLFLVKIDSDGNKEWAKMYGGFANESGYSVKQTADGGYIIAGTSSFDSDNSDIYLIKTDKNGNVQ